MPRMSKEWQVLEAGTPVPYVAGILLQRVPGAPRGLRMLVFGDSRCSPDQQHALMSALHEQLGASIERFERRRRAEAV